MISEGQGQTSVSSYSGVSLFPEVLSRQILFLLSSSPYFCCCCLSYCCFETRPHVVAQTGFKLIMQPKLVFNSQSSCFYFSLLRLQACATSPSSFLSSLACELNQALQLLREGQQPSFVVTVLPAGRKSWPASQHSVASYTLH